MGKIRESVKYITVSQGREEKFAQIVKQQGITYGKGLILDVATRWNTSYLMLNTAKHYKSVFDSLAVQDVHYTYAPTFDEWERVEVICRLLDVFYDATKVISGSKYPTSNLHFHEFWKVRIRLQIEESEVDPYIYDTVKYMRKKFEKYWNLSWMALSIPVILDPQFKYPFFQFRFQQAFGDNAPSQFSKVKSLFGQMFDEYAEMSNSGSTQQEGVDIGMGTDNNDSLADWDHHLSLTTTSSNLARSELDSYLKKTPITRSDKFDILSWWQMNSVEFPILARMARDILDVPASTVASESAFSTGGRVISDYRSRLTPEAAEALICLQDWYRASGSSELTMESIDDMLGHEGS
ncbi:zinc finger BED domain-containing protein RICESLEEPER 2 [Brachypodium distachyon]|uniref:zinc finger BED domain-containing protein RICESLEEPER 2 n=1 Tax=Brachypodium distachyon TaxID=15368 RepID=UPI00052FF584|nr:zinc finger BED domain-containing protein RICESLEEPER 2 [Brachypodium distachyon]|eukprot:XP_010236819.1 zinc finger BED domain-containing protein RICESLEEPER 2 [Brachypodium distachyon]